MQRQVQPLYMWQLHSAWVVLDLWFQAQLQWGQRRDGQWDTLNDWSPVVGQIIDILWYTLKWWWGWCYCHTNNYYTACTLTLLSVFFFFNISGLSLVIQCSLQLSIKDWKLLIMSDKDVLYGCTVQLSDLFQFILPYIKQMTCLNHKSCGVPACTFTWLLCLLPSCHKHSGLEENQHS